MVLLLLYGRYFERVNLLHAYYRTFRLRYIEAWNSANLFAGLSSRPPDFLFIGPRAFDRWVHI